MNEEYNLLIKQLIKIEYVIYSEAYNNKFSNKISCSD